MVASDKNVIPREVVDEIEESIYRRLNWLVQCAQGDAGLIAGVEALRKNVTDVLEIRDERVSGLAKGLKKAMRQRDDALVEIEHIQFDLQDIDGATHPLIKGLGQTMRDTINERADEQVERRAEELLFDWYDEILESSVEHADDNVREQMLESIGRALDMTPRESEDALALLMGESNDVMTDRLVHGFHRWMEAVADYNREVQERRHHG